MLKQGMPRTLLKNISVLNILIHKLFLISEDINNGHLMADANEVVIQLPESLATTNRRISFVVFRNDRAFQSSHGLYSVNSRILSVNIEDTTKFKGDEVS